jgi:hypothetical protein
LAQTADFQRSFPLHTLGRSRSLADCSARINSE